MENFKSVPILIVLAVFAVLGFARPAPAFAATTPTLGMAVTYGVLAGTYTNTAAGTTVNGDVGFTTAPAIVPAGIHTNYGSGAPYATAKIDEGTALTALNAQPCTFTFAPGAIDLSTDVTHGPIGVYAPGVYCSTGAMDIGGPLTLSGAGTFIFRPVGALTSTAGAVVSLAVGASACDIFWTPTAATTLAANTTFIGTVIDNANAITVGANTTWTGRALSLGAGTITTDTDTITVPVCTATLHVAKLVVNNSGGIGIASDFFLHVKNGGVDVAGSPASGIVAPGTSYTLDPGTYNVSENANAAYVASVGGACNVAGDITLVAGDNLTCTVTNDDIPSASINVVKIVINDNGGVKTVADFPLFVNGALVISGATNSFPAPAVYAVTETSNANYTQTFSGDCDAAGNVSVIASDAKFCIITNNDIVNASGGGVVLPMAVLPVPPVPPLIDVVKVPSPLALPSGPGQVIYTYTLRNIGTVPVTNITMVGDSCKPIVLISGDTNTDAKLDVNETWVYTCSTILSETHTNTVVATGTANGLTATDIASATVVVGIPLVPPLIHVTKIPSPLTLSIGGGMVAYTETITNPGTIALSNVRLTDDKCSPVQYISGDSNGDSRLDPSEAWVYTCKANLIKTTTNTAVASGEANGLTVRDFAIATVVVPVPGLPPTGLSPQGKNISWSIIGLTSILVAVLSFFVITAKKRTL